MDNSGTSDAVYLDGFGVQRVVKPTGYHYHLTRRHARGCDKISEVRLSIREFAFRKILRKPTIQSTK